MIIRTIVEQHADDAVALADGRRTLVETGAVTLPRLRRTDQRLAAHLEGLCLAGGEAAECYAGMRASPSAGALCVLAVTALEQPGDNSLAQVLALAEALPQGFDGVICGFDWVKPECLQGTVVTLLAERNAFLRAIGVAACAVHRVDPGIVNSRLLHDLDPVVRARAFRAVGELGLRHLVSFCGAAIAAEQDRDAQYWAAWSAVLLGDREGGLAMLKAFGQAPGVHFARAFGLSLMAMPSSAASAVLQPFARDPQHVRLLIQGCGLSGDPIYVPWLIERMAHLDTSRLAGEAFTLVTGVDLGLEGLDRPTPDGFEMAPSDDPDDPDVAMDPDEGLPWPDVKMVEQWWSANAPRFLKGQRYFMGKPVTREHCIDVLTHGYQRQRILAAHYLCLLNPGTPLFNTSAPAWRQQRLLAQMQ